MDVVGLYSNIPRDEGLSVPRKRLEERDEKDISSVNLVELAEEVLKNTEAVVLKCSVKKGVLRNFAKIYRETPVTETLF